MRNVVAVALCLLMTVTPTKLLSSRVQYNDVDTFWDDTLMPGLPDKNRFESLQYKFKKREVSPTKSPHRNQTSKPQPKKRLAVLVPFRDRFEELLQFIPHMHKFLNRQRRIFHIFILCQIDNNRFNRAALINVGYTLTRKNFDYMAIHDVDLLPLNNNLSYGYPGISPVHVASSRYHPTYRYDNYAGGILLIKRQHFELVRGMSNDHWGWGQEDEEFYQRLSTAGLDIRRPQNINTGKTDTFKHIHDNRRRPRDQRRCGRPLVNPVVDPNRPLRYSLRANTSLTINGYTLTVFSLRLYCNKRVTPWCRCPEPLPTC